KRGEAERAYESYRRAFALNPGDARVLFELDQLEKKRNRSPQERLAQLETHRELAERRDDLTIEYITLLNMLGRHAEAYVALMRRTFHPWEGGEGKVTGQYVISLVQQVRALIAAGRDDDALEPLERARVYPHNLGEGKLPNAPENNLDYYAGLAHECAGACAMAQAAFEKAASGAGEPTTARYYDDQPPDMLFYQGLAL